MSDDLYQPFQSALSIERVQVLGIAPDGRSKREHQFYLRIFGEFVSSGLAARLGGNATLILIALGLHAGVLGDPQRSNSEEEFTMLRELGVVTEKDRGLLFTFVGAETLADKLGVNRDTVRSNTARLIEAGIVEKRSTLQIRHTTGRFGSDVYLIRPESHIGRFAVNQPDDRAEKPGTGDDRAEKTGTDNSAENEPPCRDFRAEKPGANNSTQQEEKEKENSIIDIISIFFAQAIGVESYTLSKKEQRQINALVNDGFVVAEIQFGITRAAQEARERGQTINFSYCVPVIRRAQRERDDQSNREPSIGSGSPASVVGTGSPVSNDGEPVVDPPRFNVAPMEAESVATPGQPANLTGGNAALSRLLDLVQERNPQRALQKSDVRAWLALVEQSETLARTRGVTSLELVRQAVLAGIAHNSDRDGYFAPALAAAILDDWARGPEKTKPARAPSRKSTRSNGNGAGSKSALTSALPAPKYRSDNWRAAEPPTKD
jgi:hypothetical protein